MKSRIVLTIFSILACAACDSGREVMLAPPAEPPEEIVVPPAVMDVPGRPSRVPVLDVSAPELSSDAMDVTIDDGEEQPAAPTTSSGANALFHVCRKNESLEDVAAAYGVEPQALAKVNGFTGGTLRQGQVFLLPRTLGNVSMAPDVTTYTVVAGDTYSRIARHYHLAAAALMKLNGTESSALQVGDVLYVPNPGQ
jgi:LysM repeat protein